MVDDSGATITGDIMSKARSYIDEYVRDRALDKWGFKWNDESSVLSFSFKEKIYEVAVLLFGVDMEIRASSKPLNEIKYAIPLYAKNLQPIVSGIHVCSLGYGKQLTLSLLDFESYLFPIGEPMCALDTNQFAMSGRHFFEAVDRMCYDARNKYPFSHRESMVHGCDFSKVTDTLTHIRMRDGYVLDVFGCGPGSNGTSHLYVHRADATELYMPGDVVKDEHCGVGRTGDPIPYSADKIIAEDITRNSIPFLIGLDSWNTISTKNLSGRFFC